MMPFDSLYGSSLDSGSPMMAEFQRNMALRNQQMGQIAAPSAALEAPVFGGQWNTPQSTFTGSPWESGSIPAQTQNLLPFRPPAGDPGAPQALGPVPIGAAHLPPFASPQSQPQQQNFNPHQMMMRNMMRQRAQSMDAQAQRPGMGFGAPPSSSPMAQRPMPQRSQFVQRSPSQAQFMQRNQMQQQRQPPQQSGMGML